MKQNIFILFLLAFLVISCKNNNEIGGIKGKPGKYWITPQKMDKYQNQPKASESTTFEITHKNIDLSNYNILIDTNWGILYYGPYQKEISFHLPDKDENFSTDLIFRIINKDTDSLYYFTSDLEYYIFQAKKPIQVKLLPKEYKVDSDLKSCFKLAGCSTSLDF